MKKYLIYLSIFIFISCNTELPDVVLPNVVDNGLISEAKPINNEVMKRIEGVYSVIDGGQDFGSQVVVKSVGNYIQIFCSKNSTYFEMQSGHLDSVLIFEGFWRYPQGVETGLVTLHIKREEGATELLSNISPDSLYIRGFYKSEAHGVETPLTLKYLRDINRNENFYIIGHRGGGRNADRWGVSENSVEMIRKAERLGCNSIEIDIKVTEDSVPILFHDSKLSQRLINEKYIIGKVSEYDWRTLRSFCTLKNGEKIPTLREALDAVLYETSLKLVWLDIKSPDIIDIVAPIQKEYIEKASLSGRNLMILLGIPDEEIYDDYINYYNYQQYPALCEFDFKKALECGAEVWAPRWSEGVSDDQKQIMNANNTKIFTWTLDEAKFIKTLMKDDTFDGILSNYPMQVAYEYYIKDED